VKAIIIGAGRGARLMPTTADEPKCFARVGGRRILDWAVEAFADNGIERIVFVGGYRIDKVTACYPGFTYCHNADWQHNNILASLMHAEAEMDGPFICCYSDILFTPGLIGRLLGADGDITVAVDTDWLARYRQRSDHPSADAEKVTVADGLVTRIGRDVPDDRAHGEFIGVTKFSQAGARLLRRRYHDGRERFTQAYLIQLYQEMIESGVRFDHLDTHGEYMEIDTQQDFELARARWGSR